MVLNQESVLRYDISTDLECFPTILTQNLTIKCLIGTPWHVSDVSIFILKKDKHVNGTNKIQ